MSISKRGKKGIWWYDFTINEVRYRGSTQTTEKTLAQRYESELKTQIWRQIHLKEKPNYTWDDAVLRFVKENSHKSTKEYNQDIIKLTWFTKHFSGKKLKDITSQDIRDVIAIKCEEGEFSNATINRYLAVISALLRKAERQWEWIDKAPAVEKRKEPAKRIRWITQIEAQRLIKNLKEHYAILAKFSLVTGLRQGNVLNLRWENVNLEKSIAWVNPEEAKGRRAISIPLSKTAIEIIKSQIGKHDEFVFSHEGKPIQPIKNKTWKKACDNAGITNFKWHDLRHTWASWHVQAGTPLHVLMELGGWRSITMVLRYAHLSAAHLQEASENITHHLDINVSEKLHIINS